MPTFQAGVQKKTAINPIGVRSRSIQHHPIGQNYHSIIEIFSNQFTIS